MSSAIAGSSIRIMHTWIMRKSKAGVRNDSVQVDGGQEFRSPGLWLPVSLTVKVHWFAERQLDFLNMLKDTGLDGDLIWIWVVMFTEKWSFYFVGYS